jgi:thiol-disulfide isomerase/thioredoxin
MATLLLVPLTAQAVGAGEVAPDFALPGLGQGQVTLSSFKGRVVYLDFWASWCGPCKKSFPWMNEMKRRYGNNGFEIVAINLDKKTDDVDQFLGQLPAEFTVALDPQGRTASLYKIEGMPSSFIIDRHGKVAIVQKGFKESQHQELERQIQKALVAE